MRARARVRAPCAPIAWPSRKVHDPNAVRDARARIVALLEIPLVFDGAGDEQLPSIEQAWSVDHTDAALRAQNREKLEGIAAVLREFETLRCEVHGETGLVVSAPLRLADHLGRDAVTEAGECMDELARRRAEACKRAVVAYGVDESRLHVTATGQGGKIQVDFIPSGGDLDKKVLRFGHVPLRFVRADELGVRGWRTLHLAINCHFDPLPDPICTHSTPCGHRAARFCDKPARPSVRSWEGKADDFALSAPAVKSAEVDGPGFGPRGAYEDGVVAAFYSSTRTPNPHVGDGRLGPLGWKTGLLWGEVRKHADTSGLILWCDAACLDQVAISRGLAGARRYAESVLAALEECDAFWVHFSSDYGDSLFTTLELLAWHTLKGIHPTTTVLLNAMAVVNVAGRHARLPLWDAGRDHVAWLRAQLRKHGSVGREAVAAFRELAGVDVRDAHLVKAAFSALAALAATPPTDPTPVVEERRPPAGLQPTLQRVGPAGNHATWYQPTDHWTRGAPERADWDYGWIEPHGEGGSTHPPRHFIGGHPPNDGRPPMSGFKPPAREVWLKPGLHSDLPFYDQRRADARGD